MSEKKNDSKLPDNAAFFTGENASDSEREAKLNVLRKKLAKQQKILNHVAEKSYLEDGNLLQTRVAEETKKYYTLMESLEETSLGEESDVQED